MTIGLSLTVPATDGAGAASDASNMQGRKTLICDEANQQFSGTVIVEARAASGGWCQIASFSGVGQKEVNIPCDELRVRRLGAGTGTPTLDVSAETGVVVSAALTVPAAAGVGASTNVTTFGQEFAVFVASPFGGSIEVEGSADDTDFAQMFKSFVGPGCETKKVPANFMRVRRGGSVSGTPAVTIASAIPLESLGVGEIDGLNFDVPTTTTARIFAGSARDSTGATIIQNGGTLTADITASGANGLDTGSEATSTWYALHVIDGPNVAVASLLSLSATAPTLPAGYTVFRRVGWVRNSGGGDLLIGESIGASRSREFFYTQNEGARLELDDGAAETWTDVDLVSTVPPTSRRVQLRCSQTADGGPTFSLRTNGLATTFATLPATASSGTVQQTSLYMLTDASQVIEYINTSSGGAVDIILDSYIDEIE
jgi:hypothetical protein